LVCCGGCGGPGAAVRLCTLEGEGSEVALGSTVADDDGLGGTEIKVVLDDGLGGTEIKVGLDDGLGGIEIKVGLDDGLSVRKVGDTVAVEVLVSLWLILRVDI